MSDFDPPPRISVLLVTWNSAASLTRCLGCLAAQTLKDFDVGLVDNGSTDGSLDGLESRWPGLTLRMERLDENRGFAAANNLGARMARGHWLALLNTDAFPDPDWLEKLLQAAERHPEFSFFASRQLQANAPNLLDGAGDALHISGLAWRRYASWPAAQFGLEPEEVFSPCAAAALYSRQVFLQVGGFDEDFFSYHEDVDLGFRLRLQGFRCLYVPDAVVQHIGSAALGTQSDFALYHWQRNFIWSFVQNMPSAFLWEALPAHLMANFIYQLNYTLRGRGSVLLKAKKDALRGLSRALRKRQKIQKTRKASSVELLRTMERGPLQPYLLGYHIRKIRQTMPSYPPFIPPFLPAPVPQAQVNFEMGGQRGAGMIDFDIVIVNWNTGPQLRDCLQSISLASPASVLRLRQCVVVDNASVDGSADGLEGLPLPLTIIRNYENKGFAYACNQGAKVGGSEYILFLNPDFRLLPDSLVKALRFLEEKRNERVGILGIQLVDENGFIQRNVARFPTPSALFYQMLGLDRLWPRRFSPHFMTDWDHRESREVDQVTGAFYLMRRKMFEELHGFDERFFMYFEDLDFAYRAKQAGWKSYYLSDAQALHYGGGASNQVKAKRLSYVLNSRVLYVAKHFGMPAAWGILLTSLGIEFWIRLGWSLINLSGQNFIETLWAYGMFVRTLPCLLRELRRG